MSLQRFTTTTRITKFGHGTILRAVNADMLDPTVMKERTPSLFATAPHGSRSNQYTHISTREVLRAMWKAGFRPYEVRESGARDESKLGFTKHLVRFRHLDHALARAGDSIREVILLNSHDGSSSYRLMSGLFRLVCSNGLVVCDGEMSDIKIPHRGHIENQVIEGSYKILEDGRRVDTHMHAMQAIPLNYGQRLGFAEQALRLRYGSETPPITVEQALVPRRPADKRNDLWTTFNVVQENLIERGGIQYMHRNERTRRTTWRQTRPINGIGENVSLNQQLWSLAEQYRQAA